MDGFMKGVGLVAGTTITGLVAIFGVMLALSTVVYGGYLLLPLLLS